jgi:NADH dehydrogenase
MKVVIVGGGFGGLYAAKGLAEAPVEVTLIDRRNFHLFQPLLYQVATGSLSPANIAVPLRWVLRKQKNTRVLLDSVTGIDPLRHSVVLGQGEVAYDLLVLATGSRHHYFGREGWEELAPGLKTIEDATEIRRRILLAFEEAERRGHRFDDEGLLTFVIVGAGPTGVELAGAISEIARYSLRDDYRAISPSQARVILVEAADRVLPTYPRSLSARAQESLANLGVEVRLNTAVTSVGPDGVEVEIWGRREHIWARTVLWAAGVQASPLGAALADATGAPVDRQGRLLVEPDLTLKGNRDIYVVGDLAHVERKGALLPAVAPVAMQQGRYVAAAIRSRLAGEAPGPPFRYRDLGQMATIGRSAAVADLGRVRLWGFPAWLTWLFIHLANLAGFENRLLVFTQWAWNYLRRDRSALLITGEVPRPTNYTGLG